MQRLPNWQRRLANTISTAHEVPFEWGKWDCALAACRLIHSITGVDPAEKYRGTYSTEAEAQAIIGPDLGQFVAGIAQSFGYGKKFRQHTRDAATSFWSIIVAATWLQKIEGSRKRRARWRRRMQSCLVN